MDTATEKNIFAAAEAVLRMYGFAGEFTLYKVYISQTDRTDYYKLIFSVELNGGGRLIIKLLNEDKDAAEERKKIECQSLFSECMRRNGINTPVRYQADGRYCNEFVFMERTLNATVEDWCGDEITEITEDGARRIGELMARMHCISLENGCEIGCGTLFSAAYWNDVDGFERFSEIAADERLDQNAVSQIRAERGKKLTRLREMWETLPKSAVQGDVSINNLADGEDGLIVFDYNNAGDEVLVSDLVMEGLLTAYEMELPAGVSEIYRERLFPAMLEGYLSVRTLNEAERAAAWEIYTLYHALWFSRIMYNEDSLEKRVARGEYEAANRLLIEMLADITEQDDERFEGTGG